jgi:RecA-family ATPase
MTGKTRLTDEALHILTTGEVKKSNGAAVGAVSETKRQNGSRPKIHPPESIDALAIFNKVFPEQRAVLKDLLFTGVTLFAGRPKIGKSWLTLQMTLEVARGGNLLNRFQVERPGRVVYAALEEPQRRTNNRLRKFLTSEDVTLQNIHFIYNLLPLMGGGAEQLDAYLDQHPATMLIIDTLAAVVRAGSQRDVMRTDYAEVTTLRQLAEKHDTAAVVVTHLRKMSAEYGLDAVAGTTGVTAACDAVWTLRRLADGDCLFEVTGRDMEEAVYSVRFNKEQPFGWKLTGEGQIVKLSEERREIIELLREEAPLKPARVAVLLRKNANTVRRLLQEMLFRGQVGRNKDGGYHLPVGEAFSTAAH